ncbi:MAG: hypothetical protein JWR35_3934, partial [Marmoricola sp.]|nr:hypothetical protein [Marmoricola sp.]
MESTHRYANAATEIFGLIPQDLLGSNKVIIFDQPATSKYHAHRDREVVKNGLRKPGIVQRSDRENRTVGAHDVSA